MALPRTMRALRKLRPEPGAELVEVPVPVPGPGEVRILGVDFDGGFADYVVVPERNVWEVDRRIPPDIASIHDPFGNAVHTVFIDGGGDVVGATVVVLGCGPIGLFAVGIARAAGARR